MQSKVPLFIWGVQADLLNNPEILNGAIEICKTHNLTLIMPMSYSQEIVRKLVNEGIAFKSTFQVDTESINKPTLVIDSEAEIEKIEKYATNKFEVLSCTLIKGETIPQDGKALWNLDNFPIKDFIDSFSALVKGTLEKYTLPTEQGLWPFVWNAVAPWIPYASSSSSTALQNVLTQTSEATVIQMPTTQSWASTLTLGYLGQEASK